MIIHWPHRWDRSGTAQQFLTTWTIAGLVAVSVEVPTASPETFPDLSNIQGRINVAATSTGLMLPRDKDAGILHNSQMQNFKVALEIQTGDPCACTVLYRLQKMADDR